MLGRRRQPGRVLRDRRGAAAARSAGRRRRGRPASCSGNTDIGLPRDDGVVTARRCLVVPDRDDLELGERLRARLPGQLAASCRGRSTSRRARRSMSRSGTPRRRRTIGRRGTRDAEDAAGVTRGRLVVHGHFYQPLRADPFTGPRSRASRARRRSTTGTTRIDAECYRPNVRARQPRPHLLRRRADAGRLARDAPIRATYDGGSSGRPADRRDRERPTALTATRWRRRSTTRSCRWRRWPTAGRRSAGASATSSCASGDRPDGHVAARDGRRPADPATPRRGGHPRTRSSPRGSAADPALDTRRLVPGRARRRPVDRRRLLRRRRCRAPSRSTRPPPPTRTRSSATASCPRFGHGRRRAGGAAQRACDAATRRRRTRRRTDASRAPDDAAGRDRHRRRAVRPSPEVPRPVPAPPRRYGAEGPAGQAGPIAASTSSRSSRLRRGRPGRVAASRGSPNGPRGAATTASPAGAPSARTRPTAAGRARSGRRWTGWRRASTPSRSDLVLRREARSVSTCWAARDAYVDVVIGAPTREALRRATAGSPGRRPPPASGASTCSRRSAGGSRCSQSDAWFWDDPIRPETKQVLRAAARAVRLVDERRGHRPRGALAADDLTLFTSPSRGLDGYAIYREALAEVGQPSSPSGAPPWAPSRRRVRRAVARRRGPSQHEAPLAARSGRRAASRSAAQAIGDGPRRHAEGAGRGPQVLAALEERGERSRAGRRRSAGRRGSGPAPDPPRSEQRFVGEQRALQEQLVGIDEAAPAEALRPRRARRRASAYASATRRQGGCRRRATSAVQASPARAPPGTLRRRQEDERCGRAGSRRSPALAAPRDGEPRCVAAGRSARASALGEASIQSGRAVRHVALERDDDEPVRRAAGSSPKSTARRRIGRPPPRRRASGRAARRRIRAARRGRAQRERTLRLTVAARRWPPPPRRPP